MGRDVAHEIGMGSSFHEGVYTMLGGPNFGKYKSNRCIYQATDLSFSKVMCIKKKVLQLPILFCDGLITETVAELRMLKTCGVDAVGKFFYIAINVYIQKVLYLNYNRKYLKERLGFILSQE